MPRPSPAASTHERFVGVSLSQEKAVARLDEDAQLTFYLWHGVREEWTRLVWFSQRRSTREACGVEGSNLCTELITWEDDPDPVRRQGRSRRIPSICVVCFLFVASGASAMDAYTHLRRFMGAGERGRPGFRERTIRASLVRRVEGGFHLYVIGGQHQSRQHLPEKVLANHDTLIPLVDTAFTADGRSKSALHELSLSLSLRAVL